MVGILFFFSPVLSISWIFVTNQNTAFKMWLLNCMGGQAVTAGTFSVMRLYGELGLYHSPAYLSCRKSTDWLVQQYEKPRVNNERTVLQIDLLFKGRKKKYPSKYSAKDALWKWESHWGELQVAERSVDFWWTVATFSRILATTRLDSQLLLYIPFNFNKLFLSYF